MKASQHIRLIMESLHRLGEGTETLALEIRNFLEQHANISPNYDPEYDDIGDRFTGPDPAMLEMAAIAIENGDKPPYVHSDWGSGCYSDWTNKSLQAEHDDLVKRVNELARS